MRRSLTRREKLTVLLALNGGVLLLAALFAVAYTVSDTLDWGLFDCRVRQHYGIYCPACGGSRAVMCLFRLDIVGALRAYAPLVLCVLFLAELDVRLLLDLVRHTDTARTFRPLWRALSVLALIVLTVTVRNVLLLGFHIDLLGDILP